LRATCWPGISRDDKRSNEAALKYFLLGSFATAFFLYGVALIYGSTGSVNLTAARAVIAGQGPGGAAPAPVFIGVAAALMFVGLGFKSRRRRSRYGRRTYTRGRPRR